LNLVGILFPHINILEFSPSAHILTQWRRKWNLFYSNPHRFPIQRSFWRFRGVLGGRDEFHTVHSPQRPARSLDTTPTELSRFLGCG